MLIFNNPQRQRKPKNIRWEGTYKTMRQISKTLSSSIVRGPRLSGSGWGEVQEFQNDFGYISSHKRTRRWSRAKAILLLHSPTSNDATTVNVASAAGGGGGGSGGGCFQQRRVRSSNTFWYYQWSHRNCESTQSWKYGNTQFERKVCSKISDSNNNTTSTNININPFDQHTWSNMAIIINNNNFNH